MTIDPFVNVRAMRELLQKALLDKKDVDRHIINNVMIVHVRRSWNWIPQIFKLILKNLIQHF